MTIKRMALIALFTALMCVFTIAIPAIVLPVVAISITLQTLIVMLAALFLKPSDAFISMMLYIILGAIGLPVFSGFTSGPGVLLGPTGGFLMAFPFASYLISRFKKDRSFWHLFVLNFLFGVVFIYVFGISSLAQVNETSYWTMMQAMLIFIPFDTIKALIAAWIGYKTRNILILNQ